MQPGYARNALVLGLLSAMGPFAIDMYLPAMPAIAEDLDASIAATQASLMVFLGAVALCQIVYGPVSDMVGRRAPLFFGSILFIIGSIGCALAPTIEVLIGFRFLQGIGACAGMIVPRAIVRDLHTGPDAARLMALIMLVFSVAPVLAPLTGSRLILIAGWRAVFAAIAVAGLMALALVAFALKETRPPEQRVAANFGSVVKGYLGLLRDLRFLGVALIGGLGIASFFTFIASASFVYIDHFGLTPTQFSFAFSCNAVGFIGSAQAASLLARRFGFTRVIRTAVLGFTVMAVGLFLVTLAGVDRLPVLIGMLFLAFSCLGLVIPSTAVLALDRHGPIAGMASALMGTIQMVCGSVAVLLTSAFFDGTSLPMTAAIAGCAVLAFTLSRVVLSAEKTV
jgi:DHA1 family bicyclomycin/chloramphenicol resistance-like MFS transporter